MRFFISSEDLNRFACALLTHGGCSAEEAAIVAEHLVEANLCGHDSHGVGMLPAYMRSLNDHFVQPGVALEEIKNEGSLLIFDGHHGFGQRIAREATDRAIAHCQNTGLTLMALRSAHHIGRVGSYAEQALQAGLISLSFVNVIGHDPVVSIHNGGDARLLTNPICFALPASADTPEILLDMATSKVALGKVRVAYNKKEQLADDVLLDGAGRPTTDPGVLFPKAEGAIRPFGLHKGFGIAFFCEILAGCLSGGGTIQPANPRSGHIVNNLLTILIDPVRLTDSQWLDQEVAALSRHLLASAPASDADDDLMLPGEPERRSRRLRSREGIPIDPDTRRELQNCARAVGLSTEAL